MLVLEYKIKAHAYQYRAIDEAIQTTQFVRNKCLRYWMDSSREEKVGGQALNRYSTTLRNDFEFVKQLNSMAVQAAAERSWFAIDRFFSNCKKKYLEKKDIPNSKKTIARLNPRQAAGNFTRLKDKLPLRIKKVLVKLSF